jgi:uncharacterized protein YaaQ
VTKLLVAVVREPYVDPVLEALIAEGHRVTGLRSFGGFLREDNRTLVLAVEDSQRQEVIDIFARVCVSGEVEVPLFVSERLSDWREATVRHAGATIFVLPLEEIIRT